MDSVNLGFVFDMLIVSVLSRGLLGGGGRLDEAGGVFIIERVCGCVIGDMVVCVCVCCV